MSPVTRPRPAALAQRMRPNAMSCLLCCGAGQRISWVLCGTHPICIDHRCPAQSCSSLLSHMLSSHKGATPKKSYRTSGDWSSKIGWVTGASSQKNESYIHYLIISMSWFHVALFHLEELTFGCNDLHWAALRWGLRLYSPITSNHLNAPILCTVLDWSLVDCHASTIPQLNSKPDSRIVAPCRRSGLPWQSRSPWILLTLGATPPFTWLQGCGVSRILAVQSWSWWLSDCLGHFGTLHYWDTLGYIELSLLYMYIYNYI